MPQTSRPSLLCTSGGLLDVTDLTPGAPLDTSEAPLDTSGAPLDATGELAVAPLDTSGAPLDSTGAPLNPSDLSRSSLGPWDHPESAFNNSDLRAPRDTTEERTAAPQEWGEHVEVTKDNMDFTAAHEESVNPEGAPHGESMLTSAPPITSQLSSAPLDDTRLTSAPLDITGALLDTSGVLLDTTGALLDTSGAPLDTTTVSSAPLDSTGDTVKEVRLLSNPLLPIGSLFRYPGPYRDLFANFGPYWVFISLKRSLILQGTQGFIHCSFKAAPLATLNKQILSSLAKC